MKNKKMFGATVCILVAAMILIAGCGGSNPAGKPAEKTFPKKPIEIIVPFSAGGAVDITVRILGAEMEKSLGQKVLIVNKPGGGGVEGQSSGARANPDGYTLVALTGGVVTSTLTKQVDFTIDSFQPLALYNLDPHILVVPTNSPYKTLADLIKSGKTETITVATPGHSTANHTSGLLMEKAMGVKFKFIHTKGVPEQIPMVAGSHAQAGIASWGEIRSMVDQGKLRPLGILSDKRDPRVPNIPTFKEQGVDLVYGSWRGIAAPKGTPPEIAEILSQALKKAIESQEVKDRFTQSGFPISYMGPQDFTKYIKDELANMTKILSLLKQ